MAGSRPLYQHTRTSPGGAAGLGRSGWGYRAGLPFTYAVVGRWRGGVLLAKDAGAVQLVTAAETKAQCTLGKTAVRAGNGEHYYYWVIT